MPGRKKPKRKSAGSAVKALEISEEMKRWAALLSEELASWPQVTRKKMFGMSSFYRRDSIFAAIPDKKAFFSPTSIIFKLQTPSVRQQTRMSEDPRINLSFGIGQKWYGFELQADSDLHGALEWLDEAFRSASAKRTA
jgi:TfoX/Sxy family transcriptional regulator of competence genes